MWFALPKSCRRLARMWTPHQDLRAAHRLPLPPAGRGEVGGGQGWRPCGDFRRLNMVTVADSYPLPNMLDFASKAAGCTIFSKIDLRKGYHQIPVHPADIQKTAITTPFGSFEYLRMPFGLMNAGATFQRKVDRAVADLEAVFAYVDDMDVVPATTRRSTPSICASSSPASGSTGWSSTWRSASSGRPASSF